MGSYSIYSTVYYEGEEVTVHGYSAFDEIFSVKTRTGDIKYGIRRNELSLTHPTKSDKTKRDFKNLNAFQETQINHILDENKARDVRLRPINNELSNYIVEEIWEMKDYQIAKVRRKQKSGNINEWLYATFIDYKPLHEMGMTFDQAILICLSYKYDNRRSDAATYMARILNVNFEPEQI
jgi:hypothetical protein